MEKVVVKINPYLTRVRVLVRYQNLSIQKLQSDWTEQDITKMSFIKNKPTKTSDFENDGSGVGSKYIEENELGAVATSNDYNDLDNIPPIPEIEKTSDILLNDGATGVSKYIEFTDLDASTLPGMTIDSNWTIKKNNGDVLGTSSSSSINVDKGSKVDLVTSWKWNTLSAGQLAPTSTNGDISGTTLPSENTFSSPPLSETNIIATITFSQTMRKPKSGLEVINGQVVVAEGNDTRSINTKVSFLGRGGLFYNTSTNPTSNQIEAEINDGSFWSTRARTLTGVTAGDGEYTYIVYDAALGAWSDIFLNGVESVKGSFTKLSNINIINKAGVSIEMIIYKSNAPKAFTNNSLRIE